MKTAILVFLTGILSVNSAVVAQGLEYPRWRCDHNLLKSWMTVERWMSTMGSRVGRNAKTPSTSRTHGKLREGMGEFMPARTLPCMVPLERMRALARNPWGFRGNVCRPPAAGEGATAARRR